ncbi:MAG: imidazole glycerol phosphate synthase subunit HisH [Candidatus Sumerlaeia bacterium]|nr:imidazole glycerol phosphate synthase subunit HisH [Candidatus Sumerlaeia bacterium]
MTQSTVAVVRTGTANLASVAVALRRRGVEHRFADSPRDILDAPALVLPGVGAFKAAMDELDARGFSAALRERVAAGAPTLAICLGLQLFARSSEESPGAEGLGAVPGAVRRLEGDVRIPQLGWNLVEPDPGCGLVEAGHAYYANSYALRERPDGWSAAWTTHGVRFVAALERGPVLACQFHPELSGPWGAALLARWLAQAGVAC